MDLMKLLTGIMNRVLNRAISRGIDAGIDHFAGRGKAPKNDAAAKTGRDLAKKARQAARITRRLR